MSNNGKEAQYRWDNCHISQSDNAAEIPRRYKNVVLYSPDPLFPLGVLKGGLGTRLYTLSQKVPFSAKFSQVFNFANFANFPTVHKNISTKFLTRGVHCARASKIKNPKIAIPENLDPWKFSAIRYLLGAADFSATYFWYEAAVIDVHCVGVAMCANHVINPCFSRFFSQNCVCMCMCMGGGMGLPCSPPWICPCSN